MTFGFFAFGECRGPLTPSRGLASVRPCRPAFAASFNGWKQAHPPILFIPSISDSPRAIAPPTLSPLVNDRGIISIRQPRPPPR